MPRAAAVLVVLAVLGLTPAARADAPDALRRETADGHPMQYWVSLPRGYTPSRTWPVVVVVEAAEKQFEANARRFVAARGDRPFILVAPIIVTNGRAGQRDPDVYPYAPATWDAIDRRGTCDFDLVGLEHVLATVRRRYHAETRFAVTGFEAGAHLVWALVFLHPERLRAAVPVAGNFIERCVEAGAISRDPARVDLPVRALVGADDAMSRSGSALHGQLERAKALAVAHGYRGVTETVVPGKGHVPLPDEVLALLAP